MHEAVEANAGGPQQGQEYKPVAEWEIKQLHNALDVEDVTADAICIYEDALQCSIVMFRSVGTVACAAFYLACRRQRVPVTQREIAVHGHTSNSRLGRLVTDLQRELDLVVLPPPPTVFIPAARCELDLPAEVEAVAENILESLLEADPSIASGRRPAGIAAGALYSACRQTDHRRTQQAVAAAVGGDVDALRRVYHLQADILEDEIAPGSMNE
jgi:transcription initiation factor TFIIB